MAQPVSQPAVYANGLMARRNESNEEERLVTGVGCKWDLSFAYILTANQQLYRNEPAAFCVSWFVQRACVFGTLHVRQL
jgi:hypothetical protein